MKKIFFLWIYPFHEISCIFGSGVIFHTHTPTTTTTTSNWQENVPKFFCGFIHFMKFPAFWFRCVECDFHTHTPPPPNHHLKLWRENFLSPNGPNSEKNFFVDLSISWNFLHFWFRCDFSHTHPPPPHPTTTSNFYEKMFQVQMGQTVKINFLVDLSISWNFLHFWFRLKSSKNW